MAGLSIQRLKSLETGLKAIQAIRSKTASRTAVQLLKPSVQIRAVSCATSVGNSSIDKNIVYSRHQDFDLRTQTVVQRFIERASLWPNLTATVSLSFISVLKCCCVSFIEFKITGMWFDWSQIHVWPINRFDPPFRQCSSSNGF